MHFDMPQDGEGRSGRDGDELPWSRHGEKICPRGVGLTIRDREADEWPTSESLFPHVDQAERATAGNGMGAGRAGGAGRNELSHPAESQVFGMENSLQPQSRQTRMSGEGDMGGWLRVRGPFL